MKIVLCIHQFLPHFTGGAEIYTLRLARVLQTIGHKVYILTGEPIQSNDLSVEVREDEIEEIPVIRLGYDYYRRSVTNRASYNDPLVTTEIRNFLRRIQPDIVHAISLSSLIGGTIEAAADLNLPLIYTATDFVLTCRRGIYLKRDNSICQEREDMARCAACMGPYTSMEKLLDRTWQTMPHWLGKQVLPLAENLIGKKADFVYAKPSIAHRLAYLAKWRQKISHIVAPSTYMYDMFVLNDFPAEKITISPYGVEVSKSNLKKIPSTTLRFGFIGRVTMVKGVHTLIDAFSQISNQSKAQLTIYGGADTQSKQYLRYLKEKAAQLPNVKFAGTVNNADVPQLYTQLDLLVVPSIWPENSPITILEAQAYGVPVIASDVGGITDLVRHEENGLIFAHQNVQDLAAQIMRCIDSPELVTKLTHHSRLVKSIEQDAEVMTKLYEDVLAMGQYA